MQPVWQIPRSGLLWLLLAFIAVVAPHVPHLPVWVLAGSLFAVIWRIQVFRGQWHFPGIWIRVALLVFSLGGVLVSFGTLVGLEPMVALLVVGYSLKLLEMHRRRDALVQVFLGYIVLICLCLFSQSIEMTLYIFVAMVMVTAGLTGLHQAGGGQWQPARKAGAIVLQALPLMLVLFLVMPRFGPFWAVPNRQGQASTGISDSMSPGDFTRLGRSAEIAFRAIFEGPVPPQRHLYWRGLVFSAFDGRTWRESLAWGYSGAPVSWFGERPASWLVDFDRRGRKLDYAVILEPAFTQWLYTLKVSEPLSADVGITRDLRLVNRTPVTSKREYRARFWPDAEIDDEGLFPLRRLVETRLPEKFNPETVKVAQQWRSETQNPKRLAERVLELFNRQFTYTLRPPPLGTHSVDEFLWRSRRGFCEHFASSFVFFMRAAGVPARVVVGYQGGEFNPDQNYLTVRQYDAHAWAELWLDGEGWVRYDPTAAVAPERIERGAADALVGEQEFLADSPLSLYRYRDVAWLNRVRMQLDYLDYLWARSILHYENQQQEFLAQLLGRVNPARVGMFLLVAGGLSLLPVLLILWYTREQQPYSQIESLYLDFCTKLARAGLPRHRGEGPRDFARRASDRFPASRDQIAEFSGFFEQVNYAPTEQTVDSRHVKQKRRQLRYFRPRVN